MSALVMALAAACTVLAGTSLAAPVIGVSPARLDFPIVTLGDTVFASVKISNQGDAVLSVTAIDLPAGVGLSSAPPFDLDPDSLVSITVQFVPVDTSSSERTLVVRSNDPANPAVPLTFMPDVRALEVETIAFTTGGPYPLGEALVIQCAPSEDVRIEEVTLHFRSGITPTYLSEPMTRNGRVFIGIIPGAWVAEGGVEYYVTAKNSGYSIDDPVAGAGRPFRVDVESPRDFELSAVVRHPGFVWRDGESIDFLLRLASGSVYQSGTLHYRRGGDRVFQETPIVEASFTGIAATIPAAWVGPRGVEYWAEIQTATRRLVEPTIDHDTRPFELRITVTNLTEPDTHPGMRYRMLSIPLEMQTSPGLAALLSDEAEFGSYDISRWRSYRYLPEVQGNVELAPSQASAFTVEPGRAFWLISREPHRVDTAPVPGVSLSASSEFTIVLAPGWNQFANPFAFRVAWTKVRQSRRFRTPLGFDSERGDYDDMGSLLLEPYVGYFIENPSATPETLYIPPVEGDSSDLVVPPLPLATPAVSIRLEARTASGVDLTNRVGLAADASDERDERDQSEPPMAPGGSVRLAVVNRQWREDAGLYRRDFRSTQGEGQTWEMEVTSPEAGEAVELTLRPEGALPAGTRLSLIDREQGSVVELPAEAKEWKHTVLSFGAARSYRLALLMGSPTYVRSAGSLGLPDRVQLDPVSPNPSRGPQRIRFGLPRAADVRLEVFDAAGRRVASLVDGTLPAGFHAAIWRPEQGGGRLSSGVYFHRLTVDGEAHTLRSVVVR